MPEGDTVWRAARRLHLALGDQEIQRWDLRWPSVATSDARGQTTIEVVARGKHILHRLSGGMTLHSHLRMEGSWRVYPAPTGRPLPSTTRAVIGTDRVTAVGTSLGLLDLVPSSAESELVGHLGPDLLGPDWDLDYAMTGLRYSKASTIGAALLDQRALAGIGTMYAAESLFLRRMNPWTPVSELTDPELTNIIVTARQALTANAARARQRTTPAGVATDRWVHARAGRACLRCGTPIEVAPIGQAPQDRVMFFCPQCQRRREG